MRKTSFALVLCGVGFIGACVGGSKGISSDDKEKVKPFILESMPADVVHKIDINFENKVHLIGFKSDPDMAKPGSEIKITFYWRCDEALEEGWQLFTHVQDDANDSPIGNLDGAGALRELRGTKQILGPERWEKGKVYADEQTYKVPDSVKGATITFLTGIWKNDARLRVITGPNDGDNRATAGKVKTGLTPPPEEKPRTELDPKLSITKLALNEKIVIDGKGDDRSWGGAPSTGPFVDVGTGKPNTSFPVNATAKFLWDDANLYAFFEVKAEDFYMGLTDAKSQPADHTASGQPKMWTKDTIELMIDPDGDGDNKDYYEIQIGPQNRVFKSHFDTLQKPGADNSFGHEDWDPKMKSAVSIRKDGDKNVGYDIELSIPWVGFHKAENKPPKSGDTWRMNFYAMRNNGGVSWSPILGKGNFHHAPRFGRVTWVGPSSASDAGAPPASPSSKASASAKPGAPPVPKPGQPVPARP